MISVPEALSIVLETAKTLSPKTKSLQECNGLVLAEDCFSPIDMPPFRQSAMDGYALSISETTIYEIIGEVKAGDASDYRLKPGEAVRIFTGAPVPDSANAVIMQEHTIRAGSQLTCTKPAGLEQNIRPKGEQILQEGLALPKGAILNAAAIGYLTGLGFTTVAVYPKPSVGIVVTGNELIPAGEPLPNGKIYESNSIQLQIGLQQIGIEIINKYHVLDDYTNTLNTIKNALAENDVLLVSGGISVGDYDFVGKALSALGTKELFYKVRQKPGKPLYFGLYKNTPVFALPGNPASSLSCFYIYVTLLLEACMGKKNPGLHKTDKLLKTSYNKKGDRAHFLKASTDGKYVTILDSQSSAMLNSFALSNALVYIPEEKNNFSEGSTMVTFEIPF